MQSQLSNESPKFNYFLSFDSETDLSFSDFNQPLTPIEFSPQNSFLGKKQERKTQSNREWTQEEERLLIKLNESFPHNWRQISRLIKTKTPIQCSYKYEKISSDSKNTKFTRREDIILIELVSKYGKNWDTISQLMNNKYSKVSLKRRYFEKLLPGLTKEISENKKLIGDCNDFNNEISIALNNNYVSSQSNTSESESQTNSPLSLSLSTNSFNSAQEAKEDSSTNKEKKQLFIIQEETPYPMNEQLLSKLNQALRRLYKRLIQIYQILINLDYSNHSVTKALLIEKKRELCLQVKNYKFKFNTYKILKKMQELEDTIKFAKTKINIYLDVNSLVSHSPV